MKARRKAAPGKRKQTARRVPSHGGQLYGHLLKIIRRVDPGPLLQGKADTLNAGDRAFIAMLLRMVARDEDPRALFWTSKRGTGTREPDAAFGAALVYVAWLELGEEEVGKEAMGRVAKLSGLTDDQVDHAVRRHGEGARRLLAGFDRRGIAALANSYIVGFIPQREN